MRKVTASAVILTALTGCSQSNVPSTQWSFKVPSDTSAGLSADTVADAGQEESSAAATLTSSRSLESGSQASPSTKTQSFVSQTASGRMMGPAFEQPSAEAPLGARVSTVGRPGSKEISTLAAEAYGLTSGLSTQPSTRPDPVAQVRAYLRSSGSPSALANRTPYSSEVYLSSLPTPNRYYEPSSVPAGETPTPIGATGLNISEGLNLSEALPAPPLSSADLVVTGPISSSLQSEDLLLSDFEVSDFGASDFGASDFGVSDFEGGTSFAGSVASQSVTGGPDATIANSVPASLSPTALTQPAEFNDGLPQLQANQQGLNVAVAEEAPESIGTAILQDLQRQNAEVTPRPSVEITLQAETFQAETAQPIETEVATLSEAAGYQEPVESVYAYAPIGTQPLPSLKSLTETMPVRDVSPLVNSFRSRETVSPISEPSVLEAIPAADSNLEAFSDIEIRQGSSAPITASVADNTFEAAPELAPSDTPAEHNLQSDTGSEAHSPLLEGFSNAEPESTIYVPIAEEAEVKYEVLSSGVMVQSAANTLSTLMSESSTADFLEELADSDVFSSVITSETLGAHETLITLSSLRSQSERKMQNKRSHLKAAHRNAAVTLAAKQTSQRRQRLVWM